MNSATRPPLTSPRSSHDLAAAFDSQYFGQVLRYYNELNQRPDIECACHDRQLDLFEGDDVPF